MTGHISGFREGELGGLDRGPRTGMMPADHGLQVIGIDRRCPKADIGQSAFDWHGEADCTTSAGQVGAQAAFRAMALRGAALRAPTGSL